MCHLLGPNWPIGCHQGDRLTDFLATGAISSSPCGKSNRRAHNHLSPRLLRLGPETKETGSRPFLLTSPRGSVNWTYSKAPNPFTRHYHRVAFRLRGPAALFGLINPLSGLSPGPLDDYRIKLAQALVCSVPRSRYGSKAGLLESFTCNRSELPNLSPL